MYTQGGELFEQASKLFLALDESEEERVLRIFCNALAGVHREPGIVTWLREHRYHYKASLLPIFGHLDKFKTPNAYHVIQVARFVLPQDDLDSFCTIANLISSEEKRQLITAALSHRPRQELMSLEEFAILA